MALIKPVPTPFGVDARYHHIAAIQVHYREGCVDVHLASFLDQASRSAGLQPLGGLPPVRLELPALCDEGGSEPTRARIYAAIKARPEWGDALDG